MENASNDELIEIAPAQFFDIKNGLALFAVPVEKSMLNAGSSGLVLISSARDRIEFNDSALMQRGYSAQRFPLRKSRWSQASIRRFLASESGSTLADAYQGILRLLETHIELESYEYLEVLSLWILGTYMHRYFSAYPYIHLNGHAGTGKTKTLMLISLLAFNGRMSTETTAAALVRLTHDNQSTLCMDEVEKLRNAKDEASQTVLAILNAGYKKGASVSKMEPGKNGKSWDLKEFDPFCPKVLAGIRSLDQTLASRCIPVVLIRSANPDIVNCEVDTDSPVWSEIRDKAYEGVMQDGWRCVASCASELKSDLIQGRDWETWKPLLAIAKHLNAAFPGLYDRIQAFAVDVTLQKKLALVEDSFAGKLLVALDRYFSLGKQDQSFIILKELLDHLKLFQPEMVVDPRSGALYPWVTTRWLGGELRKSGVVIGPAVQRRIGDENTRGYEISRQNVLLRMSVHGLIPDKDPNVA